MKKQVLTLAASALALTAAGAAAVEGKSNMEIAKELANPNNTLGTMTFNNDYISYEGDLPGADDQESYKISFQPVLPYPLAEGVNLFVRPLIPVVYKQPVPRTSGDLSKSVFDDSDVELGDISYDIAIGKTFPSKFILLGGLAGSFDTATDDDVGRGQTLLGPEIGLAQIWDWGVLGALITHQWDVAGDDDFDTEVTSGQLFYTINLTDGWQIASQPTFSYNHEAASGEERWTLPWGIGVNKTTRFGKTPWKFSLQYWHYVKQADALGPDYQVRFTAGPVVPLPW